MPEERIRIGSETAHPLNGVVSIPSQTAGKLPAVVLVHGSGPSNMDEKVGNNVPFKDLAVGLSDRGIAVLRYDKRTFVYGNEMKQNPDLSVREETIEDAVLAADFLRNDSRIDHDRIYMIGHSLGGMLAPRIDAEGGNFAGLVIMGGSPRRFEELLIDQNHQVLESLNPFLKWIAQKQITSMSAKLTAIDNLSDEEAKAKKVLGKHVSAYYLKEMGEHSALNYLLQSEKPILILQGEEDFHVTVEKDFKGYEKALGAKTTVRFKLYPGLNHLFMPSVYGEIRKAKKEYNVPQHVSPQVINDIADWVFQQEKTDNIMQK